MEKEINIAELLKDCPKGMELYSTIFGPVYFEGVRDTGHAVLIDVKTWCNTYTKFALWIYKKALNQGDKLFYYAFGKYPNEDRNRN